MAEFSILIGGKAGAGIESASTMLACIFNHLGYFIYAMRDYPSLIRGGYTFSIIRAADTPIEAHQEKVNFILALSQESLDLGKLKEGGTVLFDSDSLKAEGIGLPLKKIIFEEKGPDVMKASALIGAFCKYAGISKELIAKAFDVHFSKEKELNLKIAMRGYDSSEQNMTIPDLKSAPKPLLFGNEAIGLGLAAAGMDAYLAYPMTPSSGILHFLASEAEDLNIKVIHPESEIGAVMMALGMASAGKKTAVGTSGGGFCLMTEALSFSAMGELPIAIVLGQRSGPGTGLPTYTAQSDLEFALHAGHGEFAKFVVAPGNAAEAYYWSSQALRLAWKYQISAIILSDKVLGEGLYSFEKPSIIDGDGALLWDGKGEYRRYLKDDRGISPLAFPGQKGAIVKINSYEHDENGISSEEPGITEEMQKSRLDKGKLLSKELEGFDTIEVFGEENAKTALLCWGSNRGLCMEAAQKLGLKMVRPIVMHPFPVKELAAATQGIEMVISIENNLLGQLAHLAKSHGLKVDRKILKSDGRSFGVDGIEEEIKRVMQCQAS